MKIKNRADGGPVTRAKIKEKEKENGAKILYADAVKSSCQNSYSKWCTKIECTKFPPKFKQKWCIKIDCTIYGKKTILSISDINCCVITCS
jgi:hypothetical protein